MKNKFLSLALGLGFIFVLVLLLFCGEERLSIRALWNFNDPYSIDHHLLWSLRIPRLILVFGIGGALAMLGATYQILFHNPLAEPYLLGVSSAVTLGIVISETLLGWAALTPQAFGMGFLFALSVITILILCYYWKTIKNMERIVLFGMGVNFVFSSALFILLSYHNQSNGGGSLRWLFGNIPWLNLNQSMVFISLVLPLCFTLWILGRYLDGLSLGDSMARTLGFSPSRMRTFLLVLTSLLLTVITSISGAIGFIGLVVPHAIRLWVQPPSSRYLLGLSFLIGALFLCLSDSLSRALLPPLEFPIGIVTTLLGGPLFLYLLWKK